MQKPTPIEIDAKEVEQDYIKGHHFKHFERSMHRHSMLGPLIVRDTLTHKAIKGVAILGFAASAAVLLSPGPNPLTGFSVATLANNSLSSFSGMLALTTASISAGILAVEFIINKTTWPGEHRLPSDEKKRKVEIILTQAEEHIEKSDLKGALQAYDKILSIDKENSRALLNKGYVLDETGNYRAALDIYNQMLKSDPWNSKVLYNKGITLLESNRRTEAFDCFSKALKVDSSNIPALRKVCFILFSRKEYSKAIRFCNKALDIDRDNIDMTIIKGLALERSGKKKQALEQYNTALKIDPKDVWAFKCRYELLKKDKKRK
ncbi:tetratricopeptide repeat protein [Nanoarchaeota archaeon]